MFVSAEHEKNLRRFLSEWAQDQQGVKKAFLELMEILGCQDGTRFSFHERGGVSYSLRAHPPEGERGHRPYYALIDVVEEAGGERWLSVCFYGDEVTDPEEMGNLIPKGLLEEDGYCFDVDGYDAGQIKYLRARIEEAYTRAMARAQAK